MNPGNMTYKKENQSINGNEKSRIIVLGVMKNIIVGKIEGVNY
ncbi:MAG: hypothetical protein ACOC6D_02205 [Atribacterota bacterium]